MRYQELSVTVPPAGAELVANLLIEAGTGGVIEREAGENTTLLAYFPVDERLRERLHALRGAIDSLPGAVCSPYWWSEREVVAEDWSSAWRAHYHPVEIGTRWIVAPTWEPLYRPGRLTILLDPDMAFGTGTHATTQLALTLLEAYLLPGQRVLDVGTGSGILAIAAALFGAEEVYAVEIDPVASRVARENLTRNRVDDKVCLLEGPFRGIARPVSLVLANLTADLLAENATELVRAVEPGGLVIMTGIVPPRLGIVEAAFSPLPVVRCHTEEREGWLALAYRREAERS